MFVSKPKLTVRFFRSAQGREPVRDWLKGLDDQARKAIGDDIRAVAIRLAGGNALVEKLDKDLWEVRVNLPDGIARVLFTIHQDEAVLLHGFVKKSRKIPKDDLETAKRRRRLI
jgi:phage-related protein